MCQYETVYHDPAEGFILHCRHCQLVQLGFGNVSLKFTKASLHEFHRGLLQIASEHPCCHDPFHKCITISTPYEGLNFLLCPKELDQLLLMLNAADTEMRSRELISLFGNH